MTFRFGVAIPVYNNPKTIFEVVYACIKETTYPIIVVDDGSDENVESLFIEKNNRIHFIRFPKNLGKGKALQKAFSMGIQLGLTHLITVDADGQHRAEDIKKLVEASENNPWALIVGERQMEVAQAPKASIIGRAISNFWIQYETERSVSDSQSGFRIYPLFHFQTMNFISSRYEFEVEILTRAMWRDIPVVPVSISVIYQKGVDRVTHFNKIKDNARMVLLNASLVITSLLRKHDSPFKSAMATGVGVFIGCLPVWGLHTGLAFVTSVVLRINFVYMWIGTQISAPPFIPILFYLAKKFSGTDHLPDTTNRLQLLEHWGLGFIVTGLALGTLTGLCIFVIKYLLQRKKKNKIAVRTRFTRSLKILSVIQKKFGLKVIYFFLYPISFGFFLLSLPARRASMEYWKIIKPQAGFFERQILFYKQLLVFAKTLADRAYQKHFNEMKFEIIKAEGADHFLKFISEQKKGLITIQSHIGGWEIAMSYFAKLDLPKKMVAIRYGDTKSYDHTSMKSKNEKLEIISFNLENESLIKLKNYLQEGHAAGMMGDRPVGKNYELVPFFGKLAIFDTTAVRIAKACDVEINIVLCFKENDKAYKFSSYRVPDKINSYNFACYYSSILESHLRQNPEQWFNFYPFWSKKI